MDRGVHQFGLAPPGTIAVGIPLTDGLTRWQGKHAPRGGLLSFGASNGFEGVSSSVFHGLTFTAPLEAVHGLCERLGIPLPEALPVSGVLAGNTVARRLRGTARKAHSLLDVANPINRYDEEEILASLLNASLQSDEIEDRSSARTRARAVRVALELMEESADENLPISFFCETAAVSERTLNRAFNERFDIGPKAYLLRYRLSRMRRDLLDIDGAKTVSDIANRWGFWHMGQLAREYQRQFGELPSETLLSRNSRFQI